MLTSRVLQVVSVTCMLITIVNAYENCVNQTDVMGCQLCDANVSLAFNVSENKFTCIAVPACSVVRGNFCIDCTAPYLIDNITSECFFSEGCVQYVNGSCLGCSQIGYVLLNGKCYSKSIAYCVQYNLDASGSLFCQACLFSDMSPQANCELNSTNTTICLSFNYGIGVCELCPSGTVLQSNRLRCYTPVPSCAVYDNYGVCVICSTNHVQINGLCDQVTYTTKISFQVPINLLNAATLLAASNQYLVQSICLDTNYIYNSSNVSCSPISPTPNIPHCILINGSNCIECMPNYYINSSNSCVLCQIAIPNCALCLNASVCSACNPNYYALMLADFSTKCMPCSVYGCQLCTASNTDNSITCLSCPLNYTLYMGSCIQCPPNFAYSPNYSKCLTCGIPNCRFCTFSATLNTPATCIECQQSYYLSTPNTCTPLNPNISLSLSSSYAKEVLKKAAPGIEVEYYNNEVGLMGACLSSNGLVCICANTSLTSICTTFTFLADLTNLKFTTIQQIARYPDILRMAAEFPTYNLFTQLTPSIDADSLLTQYQFWNVLSAYTLALAREQSNTTALTNNSQSYINNIIKFLTPMQRVFSQQKVTILQGNGFYFKYIPQSLSNTAVGNDNYISSSINSSYYTAYFVYFNRVYQSTALTGVIYVFTNSPSTFSITVRKSGYFDSTGNLTVQVNGNNQNNTVTLREGYFTITGLSPTNISSQKGLQIIGASGTGTDDPYQNQRIQNIFYSESWLYILFFIFLYLLFIPVCALVDCCEPEHSLRKKVGSEEPSSQKQSEDVTVLKVNYRNFFPIYNVGNTPRPQRLRKVCLFIVNMQHIVTFLTLIYFNFPGGQPIAAIALVIPAYLCTIIMGYICGAMFRLLPGNMKYTVNVFSLGYWVLWIFLMRIMGSKSSSDYRLFILVFSILSFFLDMVIDLLQTLLVYFSIRQGDTQVSLFNCLARWLSLRGYYEFDKLAKQMGNQV